MTVKEFIARYNNKEKFSERELKNPFWGYIELEPDDNCAWSIDDTSYEPDRWNYLKEVIHEFNGRYFCFFAYLGNTESQKNEFSIQPQEVKPVEVTVTKWKVIE